MRRFIPGLVTLAVPVLLLAAVSIAAETSKSDDQIQDQIHRFNVLGDSSALSQVSSGYPRPQMAI